MGFFDFLRRAQRKEALRIQPEWRRHAWPSWAGFDYSAEAFGGKSSVVAACVATLAFSFPEAPLVVGYEGADGRFVPDFSHPVQRLIRRPNPDMGEVELMQYLIIYASIGGNAYLWKQRDRGGRVVGLWPFSDAYISPIPGRDTSEGVVRGYEFDAGDGQKIELPKDDVIHWKWLPDPRYPWRGIGAIELAAREVAKSEEISAYIYALLKNNAIPPVVVSLTEGEELTEERANRLRKQWMARFGGDNRGNVAFLEYGMKAERLGFDLQQLEAEALEGIPEARIAAAFRVPPVVAGLSVGIKRSDYGDQAARRAFTELTLAALWRSLASEMQNGLIDEFPHREGWTLRFDLRRVLALQEEERNRWERITLAYQRGLITRAEAKEQLGLEAGPEDDVYLVSLANEFVSATAGEVRRNKEAGKGLETKASRIGQNLREIRERATARMATDLEALFEKQARRAVARLRGKALAGGNGRQEVKISADELYPPEDEAELGDFVRRWYVEILRLSWEAWNYALGVELAFDLDDPLVNRILGQAGTRVRDITATTLEALREVLQRGEALGWSVDDLARGADGLPGIRDIIEETYRNRAETIARTELGWAQNLGTVERYAAAGVQKVLILDNGLADDDEPCQVANGQIWSLMAFRANPLEHPNCTRAAAPYFGDEPAVR